MPNPSEKSHAVSILVSTGNRHKIQEISQILGDKKSEVCSIYDVISDPPTIVEDGATFEENAIKKIAPFTAQENTYYLADDSGIVVEALNGDPGIFSARYAGEGATDRENCDRLLEEMKDEANRRAYFACVIAIKTPKGEISTFRGEVHGTILERYYGEGGFGYDPLFIPDGFSETFAELSSEVKNAHSHRGRALSACKNYMAKITNVR